ncbi:hypothetical protein [Oryzihumus leptocrescens]|uniref:Uncharacterized protein n=1 Tax=Oryzihumus leptocrescens TaxID=297536 RepID=A0A542ZI65_9MICO|nr:hypothetical protein [Oryzihumus leptocrescens]TQL60037.1 hypothetical protein FB474_1413 [Oryzihumus leptocrescens]
MTRAVDRPAFYAGGAGTGGVRDWVTLLHPPYTAWHLSYVAIGAALAPHFTAWRLGGTLAAFFLAVGVGAHALDELAGRPLQTGIPAAALVSAAGVSIAAAVVAGLLYGGLRLLPFVVVGAVLVLAYNLELGRGILHNGVGFALGWGAFPVLTGYYAQDFRLGTAAVLAAAAAFFLSLGQRALSLPARTLRRRTQAVHGRIVYLDGGQVDVDRNVLLGPLEGALRAVAGGLVMLAAAMVASRL